MNFQDKSNSEISNQHWNRHWVLDYNLEITDKHSGSNVPDIVKTDLKDRFLMSSVGVSKGGLLQLGNKKINSSESTVKS